MPVGTDRYPSDPSDPIKRLEERIRQLEIRLAEQNRRNPLNSGMFTGTLRMVGDSGTVAAFGDIGIGFSGQSPVVDFTSENPYDRLERGLLVQDEDGNDIFLAVDQSGLVRPRLSYDWQDTTAKQVTSSTMESQWLQVLNTGTPNRAVFLQGSVFADTGVDGEVQVTITDRAGVAPTVNLDVLPIAGDGTTKFWRYRVDLEAAGFDAIGARLDFRLLARRTLGANPLLVNWPQPLYFTYPEDIDATDDGDGVIL